VKHLPKIPDFVAKKKKKSAKYQQKCGPVTNNENINIDGSKILTSTAVWPLRNINIDDRK
jgi:hypothetical protein